MARGRKKIMGIPVGRAKKSMPFAKAARVGALGATVLAAVPAAQRGLHAVNRGQDLMSKAGDALGTAGDVKDAVSSHSSTVGKAVGLIGAVTGHGKDGGDATPKLRHLIEEHTDISVPRSVAYNQWTQMEIFPSVVKGVASVDQSKEDRTEWSSKIGPVKRTWKAKIVEQVPDERIAWRSEGGPELRGVVTFHSLDEDLTRVLVQMHYVPHGPLEVVGNELRIQRRRVRRDLRMFKHFMEMRGAETGAWRGSIGEAARPAPKGRRQSGANGQSGRSANGRSSNGQSSRSGNGQSSRSTNGRSSARSTNGQGRPRGATSNRSKETAK